MIHAPYISSSEIDTVYDTYADTHLEPLEIHQRYDNDTNADLRRLALAKANAIWGGPAARPPRRDAGRCPKAAPVPLAARPGQPGTEGFWQARPQVGTALRGSTSARRRCAA